MTDIPRPKLEVGPVQMPAHKSVLALLARYGTILGLCLMVVVFSALSPIAFPTLGNGVNVLNQASLAAIIAGGLTIAVIVGELDLSIGFAASMEGVLVTGLIVHAGLPIPLAILLVLAGEMMQQLRVRAPNVDTPVGRLSGGNQQKVLIGKWLSRRPRVLILDEPTRGVDIGARAEIHRLIRNLAADGVAVIVISSEAEELPEVCDRVLVMAEGRVVKELAGAEMTRANIVQASYSETHAHHQALSA